MLNSNGLLFPHLFILAFSFSVTQKAFAVLFHSNKSFISQKVHIQNPREEDVFSITGDIYVAERRSKKKENNW